MLMLYLSHVHVRLTPHVCDRFVRDVALISFKEQTIPEYTMQKVSSVFLDLQIKTNTNKVRHGSLDPIICHPMLWVEKDRTNLPMMKLY